MKLQITILYKSGVERIHNLAQSDSNKEITKEELEQAYKTLEEYYIQKCYKDGIHASLQFENDNNESVSINIPDTSEIKFKIV